MSGEVWASDVPVSRPEPISTDQAIVVEFGGIGFSTGGLAHALTAADVEDVFMPYFAPEGYEVE